MIEAALDPRSQTLPRVLLIHDDGLWLMKTARELRERGFLVTDCNRPEEALDWLEESRPDCAVIDATMSRASGFEVCRKLRTHARGSDLPVLMLVADAGGEAFRLAHEAGASDLWSHNAETPIVAHRIRQMLWVAWLERSAGVTAASARIRGVTPTGRFSWRPESGEVQGDSDLFVLLDRPGDQGVLQHADFLASLEPTDSRRLTVAMNRLLQGGAWNRPEVNLQTLSSGLRRLRIEVQQVVAQPGGGVEVGGRVLDVTPASGAETKVYRLTHYDTLTGLPNRTWLHTRLKSGRGRGEQGFGLAVLDLDRVDEVSEAFGQDVRDRLIIEVAQRLRRLARTSRPQWGQGESSPARIAALAYLGGDGFALLLEDLADPQDAMTVCRNVVAVLGEPLRIGDREVFLNASVGVHIGGESSEDPADWLGRAELARRAAASSGGNRVLMFEPAMSEEATDRLVMERDLYYAIARDEMTMYLQPKFSGRNRRLIGFEALMRWTHQGALRSPGRFIPLAEETGLIGPLGEWAIDQACAAIAAIARTGLNDCPVSVNLSPRQLHDGRLPGVISAALARHRVRPDAFEVELTESGLMQDPEQALAELSAIRSLGVGLAIDDFGTGFSSLAYLTRLPLTALKIDRSFVQEAHCSERSRAVVAAIVGLATNLRLTVVAEGVETESQSQALLALGCDAQQGYLFGKAVPLEQALLMARHAADPMPASEVSGVRAWPQP